MNRRRVTGSRNLPKGEIRAGALRRFFCVRRSPARRTHEKTGGTMPELIDLQAQRRNAIELARDISKKSGNVYPVKDPTNSRPHPTNISSAQGLSKQASILGMGVDNRSFLILMRRHCFDLRAVGGICRSSLSGIIAVQALVLIFSSSSRSTERTSAPTCCARPGRCM
jgi:hypothetical protein